MPESKPKPEQVQLLKDLKRAMIYNHIDPNLIRYYIYISGSWEEFYESFLSPEYINKRLEEIGQEAKRKKIKAHPMFCPISFYLIFPTDFSSGPSGF